MGRIRAGLVAALLAGGVAACGGNHNPNITIHAQTGAPGGEATGTVVAGSQSTATTTQAVVHGAVEASELIVQTQSALSDMYDSTRNLATNDSGTRGQARDELLTVQRRTASLAARARIALPSDNPARSLIVAVDDGASAAAGALQGVSVSDASVPDRLRAVAGAVRSLMVHIGQVTDLVTTRDRQELASDLRILRERVSLVS